MKLTSRSGQTTIELTDRQWAALVQKFGSLAKMHALTWAGRRRTHAESRARGYSVTDEDRTRIEHAAYVRAAVRLDAERPIGYVNGLERIALGARLSPGMAAWAARIVVTDEDRAEAERADREQWEWETQEITSDPLAWFGITEAAS